MTPATASSVPTPIAPLASQAPGAAAVTAPSGSSLEHVLFIVLGLLVLAVAALLLLRFLHSLKQRRSGLLRLIGELSVGRRERIAVVQVGQKFIVVGVTSTQVTRLAEYDSLLAPGLGSVSTSAFGVDHGGRHPPGVG